MRLRNTAQNYIINMVHKLKFLLSVWTEYKIPLMHLFSAPEIFIPDAYGTKNWCRKLAPQNGVDLWRRFLERVSWVLGILKCRAVAPTQTTVTG